MTVEQLQVLEPEKTVDARGTACPGPLLEAKRAMTQVAKGGLVELLSSDQSSNRDIPLWARKAGHEYLGTVEEAGFCRIYVRRGQ